MFGNITPEGWKKETLMFEIIVQILQLLENPDENNYFESTAEEDNKFETPLKDGGTTTPTSLPSPSPTKMNDKNEKIF